MKEEELEVSLITKTDDAYIRSLQFLIRCALRVLAFLMVLVILWGVADVCWVLYERTQIEPYYLLNLSDIFSLFSAFLTVLIAIEIFLNIVLYLKDNVIHVRLVVATALMAISRKIIGFDYEYTTPMFVIGSAATVFALGITYWLLQQDFKLLNRD